MIVSGIRQYNELLLYEDQTFKVNIEGCLNFGLSCKEALSKVRKDGTNQTVPSVFSCMYKSDQKIAISQYVSPEDTRTFFIIMSTILLETFVVSLFLMLAASKMWKVSTDFIVQNNQKKVQTGKRICNSFFLYYCDRSINQLAL